MFMINLFCLQAKHILYNYAYIYVCLDLVNSLLYSHNFYYIFKNKFIYKVMTVFY